MSAPSRSAITLAVVGGTLLVLTPPLVEFVSGDFFLLLPLALLLALLSMIGLRLRRRGVAAVVFAVVLVLALATEVFEQSLSGKVPVVADVLPPVLFSLSGIALLVVALDAHRARRSQAQPQTSRDGTV